MFSFEFNFSHVGVGFDKNQLSGLRNVGAAFCNLLKVANQSGKSALNLIILQSPSDSLPIDIGVTSFSLSVENQIDTLQPVEVRVVEQLDVLSADRVLIEHSEEVISSNFSFVYFQLKRPLFIELSRLLKYQNLFQLGAENLDIMVVDQTHCFMLGLFTAIFTHEIAAKDRTHSTAGTTLLKLGARVTVSDSVEHFRVLDDIKDFQQLLPQCFYVFILFFRSAQCQVFTQEKNKLAVHEGNGEGSERQHHDSDDAIRGQVLVRNYIVEE